MDPLSEAAPGWNPYRYGFNNPMRFVDPSGMIEEGKVPGGEEEERTIDLANRTVYIGYGEKNDERKSNVVVIPAGYSPSSNGSGISDCNCGCPGRPSCLEYMTKLYEKQGNNIGLGIAASESYFSKWGSNIKINLNKVYLPKFYYSNNVRVFSFKTYNLKFTGLELGNKLGNAGTLFDVIGIGLNTKKYLNDPTYSTPKFAYDISVPVASYFTGTIIGAEFGAGYGALAGFSIDLIGTGAPLIIESNPKVINYYNTTFLSGFSELESRLKNGWK